MDVLTLTITGLSYPTFSSNSSTLVQSLPYLGWTLLIIACWASRLFPSLISIFNYGKLLHTQHPPQPKPSLSPQPNTISPQLPINSSKSHIISRFFTAPIWYTSHSFGFSLYYKISFLILFFLLSEIIVNVLSKFFPFPAFIIDILPFLPLRYLVSPFHLSTISHIPYLSLFKYSLTSTPSVSTQPNVIHLANSLETNNTIRNIPYFNLFSQNVIFNQVIQFNSRISYITLSHYKFINIISIIPFQPTIIDAISYPVHLLLSLLYSFLSLPIYFTDMKYTSFDSLLDSTTIDFTTPTILQYLNSTATQTQIPLDVLFITTLWSSLTTIIPSITSPLLFPSLHTYPISSTTLATTSFPPSQLTTAFKWSDFLLQSTFLSMGRYVFCITLCIALIFVQITRRLYETYFVHTSSKALSNSPKSHKQFQDSSFNESKQHIAVTFAGLVYYLLVILTPFTFSYISLYTLPTSVPTLPTLSPLKFYNTIQFITEAGYNTFYTISYYFIHTFIISMSQYQSIPYPKYDPRILFINSDIDAFPSHNSTLSLSPIGLYCFFYFSLLCLCIVFFVLFSFIQHRCHKILASLRCHTQQSLLNINNDNNINDDSNNGKTHIIRTFDGKYALPTQGWFKHIACPHYLAEVLIYAVLAILVPYHPSLFTFAASAFTFWHDYILKPIVFPLIPSMFDSNILGYDIHNYIIANTFTSFLHFPLVFTPMTLCFCWVISNLYIMAQGTHQWYSTTFGFKYDRMKKNPLSPSFFFLICIILNPLAW